MYHHGTGELAEWTSRQRPPRFGRTSVSSVPKTMIASLDLDAAAAPVRERIDA